MKLVVWNWDIGPKLVGWNGFVRIVGSNGSAGNPEEGWSVGWVCVQTTCGSKLRRWVKISIGDGGSCMRMVCCERCALRRPGQASLLLFVGYLKAVMKAVGETIFVGR